MDAPLADRFRSAIASGAYWTAEELLVTYRGEIERRWSAAASDTERSDIKNEVDALLSWARTMTLARRSHTQAKLVRLNSQRAYAGTPSQPTGLRIVSG
jgi:hypothetical protein